MIIEAIIELVKNVIVFIYVFVFMLLIIGGIETILSPLYFLISLVKDQSLMYYFTRKMLNSPLPIWFNYEVKDA